jgi:hypothetical protein
MEVKRGRRIVTLDPRSSQPACEMATPTLSAIEWMLHPATIELSSQAVSKMRELAEKSPEPSPRLRAAAKRQRK